MPTIAFSGEPQLGVSCEREQQMKHGTVTVTATSLTECVTREQTPETHDAWLLVFRQEDLRYASQQSPYLSPGRFLCLVCGALFALWIYRPRRMSGQPTTGTAGKAHLNSSLSFVSLLERRLSVLLPHGGNALRQASQLCMSSCVWVILLIEGGKSRSKKGD